MSKVTTTFEFDTDEDAEDLKVHLHAKDLAFVVSEFKNYLRNLAKYSEHSEAEATLVEEIRSKFHFLVSDNIPCLDL